jgi:hypothetical protein
MLFNFLNLNTLKRSLFVSLITLSTNIFSNYLSRVRLLNDNLLEGRVPEELYSIGVHGGAIEYVTI